MSSDNRGSWPLDDARPPTKPHEPGEHVRVSSSFVGPLSFVRLWIGPDPRLGPSLTPRGVIEHLPIAGRWRIDEVLIEDKRADVVIAALEAETLSHEHVPTALWVSGDFGVGSSVAITATNISDAAAYFYATWETEDIH